MATDKSSDSSDLIALPVVATSSDDRRSLEVSTSEDDPMQRPVMAPQQQQAPMPTVLASPRAVPGLATMAAALRGVPTGRARSASEKHTAARTPQGRHSREASAVRPECAGPVLEEPGAKKQAKQPSTAATTSVPTPGVLSPPDVGEPLADAQVGDGSVMAQKYRDNESIRAAECA